MNDLNVSLDQLISNSTKLKGGAIRRSPNRTQRQSVPYRNAQRPEKRVNQSTTDCALKFLVNNAQASVFIGTGGQGIKELIEVTGANIHISRNYETYPGTTDRVIYISGNEDSVSSAQSLFWEMVAQTNLSVLAAKTTEWSPKRVSESQGEFDNVNVDGKITIPADAAGIILGRGGATIRAIAEESGAKLSVSTIGKDHSEETQERIVYVSGSALECINCTSLILAKLSEDATVSSYVTPGSVYPQQARAGAAAGAVDTSASRTLTMTMTDHSHHGAAVSLRRASGVTVAGQAPGASARRRLPLGMSSSGAGGGGGSERTVQYVSGGTGTGTGSGSGATAFSSTAHAQGHSHGHAHVNTSVAKTFGNSSVPLMSLPNGAETISASTTISLAIPDHLIGNILGKQGQAVRDIMSLSGAQITISARGEFVHGTTSRIVTINGSPACAQTAHTLIAKKLEPDA